MRTMKKLGEGDTVRLFVPVTVEMREAFREVCGDRNMADVVRDFIADTIASAKPKRRATARQKEDA